MDGGMFLNKSPTKMCLKKMTFPLGFPVNMPDPAGIRFGSGQLWPLRPAGIGPDPIWFWVVMSGFGQTGPFRKQAGLQESSRPVPANRFRAGSVAGSGPVPACLLGSYRPVFP